MNGLIGPGIPDLSQLVPTTGTKAVTLLFMMIIVFLYLLDEINWDKKHNSVLQKIILESLYDFLCKFITGIKMVKTL